MLDIDETTLRDLMTRSTADLHLDPGLGGSIVRAQRRRHRRSVAGRMALSGLAVGVAAGVAVHAGTGGDGPGQPAAAGPTAPLRGVQLTAAYRSLVQLSSIAAAATAGPAGRYLTMTDDQSDSGSGQADVQTSVWDGVTGDVWTHQSGAHVQHSFPVQVHGSPTAAEFAAMPTDQSALRAELLAESDADEAQAHAFEAGHVHGAATPAELDHLRKELARAEAASEQSDDAKVFLQAQDLLYNPLVPPALRAALLQLLADTPDVRVDPKAVDAHGRAAVKISLASSTDGGTETYLYSTYLSPKTTIVLENSQTMTNTTMNAADTTTDVFVSVTGSDTRPGN
jgi:hypothetical protein